MAQRIEDDYSRSFGAMRDLIDRDTEGGYKAFVRSLPAGYGVAWRDIALGYAALVAGYVALALLPAGVARGVGAAVVAVWTGYWIAYLQLFIHEAAHYNLAGARQRNDRLADALLSWHVGTSIAAYRATHFQHHRALGGPDDSETSYFHALTPRFLAETLTGIHALRVFRDRRSAPRRGPGPLARGIVLHTGVVAGLWFAMGWPGPVAWIVGMASFFPLFASLRQLLEHRAAAAAPASDAAGSTPGAVTRLFAGGPLSSTFGGAGFNRHLLHHWEPHLAYARLADLERYLDKTRAGPLLASRRTTYGRTLLEIFRKDNARRP